jgi:hypothetical protein
MRPLQPSDDIVGELSRARENHLAILRHPEHPVAVHGRMTLGLLAVNRQAARGPEPMILVAQEKPRFR